MDEFDVFLSHNSNDKNVVRRLAKKLRNMGLKPWFDEWELPPGQAWMDALNDIITTCKAAAVCVGPSGIGPWEDPEMQALLIRFVNEKKTGNIMPVIPVLLPKASKIVELPIFLETFTWVDLRQGLLKNNLDRLKWGITGKKQNADETVQHEKPVTELGNSHALNTLGAADLETQNSEMCPCEILERVFKDIDDIKPLPPPFLFSNSVFPGTSATRSLDSDRKNLQSFSDALTQTPMIRFAARDMSIEALARKLRDHYAMLVFVGSQGTGKTWLAHQLVHEYCKKYKIPVDQVPIAPIEPPDVIGPITRGHREYNAVPITNYYALYAAWAKKFVRYFCELLPLTERATLRKHPHIQDLDDYMEDIAIVIKDLKDRRKRGVRKSIVSVVADSIYQTLANCDVTLPDQLIGVLVLDVEDVYAYEFEYESEGRELIAEFNKSLDEEVDLQSKNGIPQVEKRLKIIVTTRQLEVQFEKPRIPLVGVRYFNLQECTQFVEEHLRPFIPDQEQLSRIASEAHHSTNGYPWFFYRYLEATLFVYLNTSATVDLSEILSIVRNSSVFWAYNVTFDENFRQLLGESINAELPEAPGDDGRFFAPIRAAFRRNNDLYATYEWAVSEMSHDDMRTPSSGTKRDVLPLIQVGLLDIGGQGKEYRLAYTNDIVSSFFNPTNLRVLCRQYSGEV